MSDDPPCSRYGWKNCYCAHAPCRFSDRTEEPEGVMSYPYSKLSEAVDFEKSRIFKDPWLPVDSGRAVLSCSLMKFIEDCDVTISPPQPRLRREVVTPIEQHEDAMETRRIAEEIMPVGVGPFPDPGPLMNAVKWMMSPYRVLCGTATLMILAAVAMLSVLASPIIAVPLGFVFMWFLQRIREDER